jgi:hypothetical protein
VLRPLMTQGADLAARLIIKYEDDNPLHVETQKDFDVVCNMDIDAFCQGISLTVNTKTTSCTMDAILVIDGYFVSMYIFRIMVASTHPDIGIGQDSRS